MRKTKTADPTRPYGTLCGVQLRHCPITCRGNPFDPDADQSVMLMHVLGKDGQAWGEAVRVDKYEAFDELACERFAVGDAARLGFYLGRKELVCFEVRSGVLVGWTVNTETMETLRSWKYAHCVSGASVST